MPITIDYHGITATGKNKTEAKAAAQHRLDRILDNLSPLIFAHNGHTLTVWQTHNGSAYTITRPDDAGRVYCTVLATDDRDTMAAYGIKHLLDYTRQIGDYDLPSWANAYFDHLQRARLLSDWHRADRFQRAYAVARRTMGEVAAHHWAGNHCHEQRFGAPVQMALAA